MTKTYKANLKCSNCGHIQAIQLDRGTPVDSQAIGECNHCGCASVFSIIPDKI